MPETKNTISPQITMGEIYEGGSLNSISIPELLNNEVAIRQLVNEVNYKNTQIENLNNEKSSLQGEIVALRNQTLIRWQDAVFNAVGAAVMAIGTNVLSSNLSVALALIIIGIICIAIVNLWGIFRANRAPHN